MPLLLPFRAPTHATRPAQRSRSTSDKRRRSPRRSFHWPGKEKSHQNACSLYARFTPRDDPLSETIHFSSFMVLFSIERKSALIK